MAAAIAFWLIAAAGGYAVRSAQRSGEMFIFPARPFGDNQVPLSNRLIREDNPKAFQDALQLRLVGVGLFVVGGFACAIGEWLGISN